MDDKPGVSPRDFSAALKTEFLVIRGQFFQRGFAIHGFIGQDDLVVSVAIKKFLQMVARSG